MTEDVRPARRGWQWAVEYFATNPPKPAAIMLIDGSRSPIAPPLMTMEQAQAIADALNSFDAKDVALLESFYRYADDAVDQTLSDEEWARLKSLASRIASLLPPEVR